MRSLRLDITDDYDLTLFDRPNTLQPRKKQNAKERKQRKTEVAVSLREPTVVRQVRLSRDARELVVIGRPDSPIILRDSEVRPDQVELVHYYMAGAKRKTLCAFYMHGENPPANIHWAFARYNMFFAVDTNSVEFAQNKRVSASVALVSRWQLATRDHSMCEFSSYGSALFEEASECAELFALSNLMQRVEGELPANVQGRVGFITDTELTKIKDMNLRRIPVYRDFYLPAQFELIYATADSGSQEFFPNTMMRTCDRAATQLLREHKAKHKLTASK